MHTTISVFFLGAVIFSTAAKHITCHGSYDNEECDNECCKPQTCTKRENGAYACCKKIFVTKNVEDRKFNCMGKEYQQNEECSCLSGFSCVTKSNGKVQCCTLKNHNCAGPANCPHGCDPPFYCEYPKSGSADKQCCQYV